MGNYFYAGQSALEWIRSRPFEPQRGIQQWVRGVRAVRLDARTCHQPPQPPPGERD